MAPSWELRASYEVPTTGRDRHNVRERHVRLGTAVDVALTVLDDLSILPATRALGPRVQARLLRAARSWMVSCVEGAARPSVRLNSNSYLSNAFVLKALAPVS